MTDTDYEPNCTSNDDMVTLIYWMAESGYDKNDIKYAVEKPWKFKAEAVAAFLDIDEYDFRRLADPIWDDHGDVDDVIKVLRNFARARAGSPAGSA